MISRLKAFAAFWYDFIVGDDWRVALGAVVALAVTYGVSSAGMPAWWILPVAIAILLPLSLLHATRKSR